MSVQAPAARVVPAVIYARDASPGAIGAAMSEQARQTRWGRFGPIGPQPMVIIPGAAPAAVPRAPARPVRAAAPPAVRPTRQRPDSPLSVACGLATPYRIPTRHGSRSEQLAPGAFAGSLSHVVARLGHEASAPVVGSTQAGTLRLFDGARGLRFQLDLTSPEARREGLIQRVDAECFCGTSVGYYAERVVPTGTHTSTILRATLFEVVLVHRSRVPKHRGTHVSLALACHNCRAVHLEGYVHLAADCVLRCRGCGMRYATTAQAWT